ncbi:MAG TPA: agmatine deiminase family protein [Candidatus Competibacteraceae bacterium]|nr:agmatine deiminase family protein [Candidatus Competibacteraceae bacterium]
MSISKCVLPAEWQPQAAILLTWPHAHSDWRPSLTAVERTFTLLSTEISRRQAVIIACYDAVHRNHIQALLRATGAVVERIRLYCVPSNDAWARDHGPITVYRNGVPVLLDFRFNGWGGKYVHELDNQVTARLHSLGAFGATPIQSVDLILEGGSIESDGQGTLLTTSQCLLTPTRNRLPREVLAQRLREVLGIERFLWLNQGHLSGDDTDSHIDTLARFCDPGTIAYQACTDSTDDDYESLQAMEQELRAFRTPAGEPYRLVPLPWPRPRYNEEGWRLPAGYANFLIINNAVLMPTYDDSADSQALACLRACFPGREIIGIPSLPLIQQYGSLHCVTMQLPVGIL